MTESRMVQMIDITAPGTVEVQIRKDGKVVWINIDGICRLRACQVRFVKVIDERPPRKI